MLCWKFETRAFTCPLNNLLHRPIDHTAVILNSIMRFCAPLFFTKNSFKSLFPPAKILFDSVELFSSISSRRSKDLFIANCYSLDRHRWGTIRRGTEARWGQRPFNTTRAARVERLRFTSTRCPDSSFRSPSSSWTSSIGAPSCKGVHPNWEGCKKGGIAEDRSIASSPRKAFGFVISSTIRIDRVATKISKVFLRVIDDNRVSSSDWTKNRTRRRRFFYESEEFPPPFI